MERVLERQQTEPRRRAWSHARLQGTIERYHPSIRNIVNLQNYFLPRTPELVVARFVGLRNRRPYQDLPDDLTPPDACFADPIS